MIFESRNYHYDPNQFEAYLQWARKKAVRFSRRNWT